MTSRDLQGFCAAIALNNDPRGGGALFVAGGKFTRGFARQKNFYNAFLTWAYGKLRWIRNARLLCVRVSQFFAGVGPVGAGGIGSIGDWAFGEFHRFEHPAPKNFVSRQIGVVCATGFVTKSDSRVGGQCVANPRSITRGHQFYVKQEVGYES